MDAKQIVMLAFQVSIFLIVLGFGLEATTRDIVYLVRRRGLLLRSLLSVFVVVPLVAVVLAGLFDFRPTTEIALIALSLSPVPPLLPGKEAKAGGDRAYGLALMAVLALLAIVFIPIAVELLALFYDRPFTMAPGGIARVVLLSTLIPLVVGMVVRGFLPRLAERLVNPLGILAKVLLLLAVLALLFASWGSVSAAIGDGTVVAMVIFIAAGLLAGHLMAGPEPEQSVVLALSSAYRHPAIALSIAATNFPDERFGGTIILYLIVGGLAGIPYLLWHRRQVGRTVLQG